jgi:predicted Zn-dependent protease
MSFQEYEKFLNEHQLSTDQSASRMVKTVGTRISQAVEMYLRQSHMAEEINNYKWEFNLIESEEINAWAMPGGKVVVYSGILPIAKDETGLAVIMGHEIGHIVAGHGNERMSHGLAVQMGGIALSAALSSQPQATRELFMTAFGTGTQVGFMLPYSRLHEREADHLGLIFMAMAGYDPRSAVDFWERMTNKKEGSSSPPEFLSTHPSDQNRIQNIQELIPQVMPYYYESIYSSN